MYVLHVKLTGRRPYDRLFDIANVEQRASWLYNPKDQWYTTYRLNTEYPNRGGQAYNVNKALDQRTSLYNSQSFRKTIDDINIRAKTFFLTQP